VISLIAAIGKNRVIGNAGKLPWHLPEDLRYFKKTTSGHPIIMGRKTYDSIGRLLPGRENRIVTRQAGLVIAGARVFESVESACRTDSGDTEIFVIGGSEIYTQALPFAERLYLTFVEGDFEGDAFFPPWDTDKFHEVSREHHALGADRKLGFSFVRLEKTD
jgi:dihydrofolate reductase